MNLKLALSDMKSRYKDYLVLFSGVLISSAIFYMFQSISSNESFLKNNSGIRSILDVFHLGSFFLAIVTLVYIIYANSFLLSMRQRVYAMYMMFGAKGGKIAQLFFLETLTIGILAVGFGIFVGIGLTEIVSRILVTKLNMDISYFTSWNGMAVLITGSYFLFTFMILAISNAVKMIRTPILKLMNQEKIPTRIKKNRTLWTMEVISGIGLLAFCYRTMINLKETKVSGGIIVIITIILGTYFVCDGLFLAIVQLLRSNNKFRFRKLHSFTLGQLSFRIRDFAKILSEVAIVLGLSLGAITVGFGFQHQIIDLTNSSSNYDLLMHDPTKKQEYEISKLDLSEKNIYHYKIIKNKIYWRIEDFNKYPFYELKFNQHDNAKTTIRVTGKQILHKKSILKLGPGYYLPEKIQNKESIYLTDFKYQKIRGRENKLNLYILKNFVKSWKDLKPFVDADNKKIKARKFTFTSKQKYEVYQFLNGIFSGLEFMGLFLGIAFLAMLASCLMFKILVGATNDIERYHMLNKLGARKNFLNRSIEFEIGFLFIIPTILGIPHVLFGLKIFEIINLLDYPYKWINIPFGLFFILYFGYYALTVSLYKSIVLPKKEKFI